MEWFKKHLNLTWLLYMFIAFCVCAFISLLIFPHDGKLMAQTTVYIWAFVASFPIDIWVFRQKNRSWVWSLLILLGLYWLPLVFTKKKKPIESAPTQSQTSAVHHSDGCSETHTHSDKTGDI